MTDVKQLLTQHLDIWLTAEASRKSGRGRSSGSSDTIYGVQKLRELILDLAVTGKLTDHLESDSDAGEILKIVNKEKESLISEGKLKKVKYVFSTQLTNSHLPKKWVRAHLGELSLLITDGTHHTPKYLESGVPFVSVKDVNGRTISFDDCKYISEKEHAELIKRCKPEKNDILLCRIGTLGRATIVDVDHEFSIFVSLGLLKLSKKIDYSKYLHIFLHSPQALIQFEKIKVGGSHTNKLNLKDLPHLYINLPPLEEQQRIVAKVDELMQLCDQLEAQQNLSNDAHAILVDTLLKALTESCDAEEFQANWQRIVANFDLLFTTDYSIEQLKQSILQLAVMGKLVKQDPSDEPASELLKQIAEEKSKLIKEGKIKKSKPLPEIDLDKAPFEIPSNWAWARFSELGEFGRGKSKHRPRNDPNLFNPPIYPLVQTGEVARAKNIITEYHSKYSEVGLAQSKMWSEGTLCITIAANIADTAILGFDACFPDSVVGFVPVKPLDSARYLLFFMKTAREQLLAYAPATAQKNINLEILESVYIPTPPLNEQHKIIEKVDSIVAIIDALKVAQSKLQQTELYLADALVVNIMDGEI